MGAELPDVEVMDVFVLDDHGRLRTPPPVEADPSALRHTAHDAVRHLREVKATPGYRLGNAASPVVRLGTGEEVIHPVLIDADRALERLVDGTVLSGLPGLRVDLDSCHVRGSTSTWDSHLETGPPRGDRAAVLRLRPTPSRTVTIIELIPVRPRRFGFGTFVQRGVIAVAELGAHLSATPR